MPGEREIVVQEQRVTYEGIFSLDELHKTISDWCANKHYDRLDKLHTESVKPEGKFIDIELQPDKNIDDYTNFMIRIRIYASNIKDVTVEMDGRKRRLNQGKVQIVLDAFIKTDYQGRMEGKPIYTFFRTLYDKYIYKSDMARHEDNLKSDVAHLKETIYNYLNLFKMR